MIGKILKILFLMAALFFGFKMGQKPEAKELALKHQAEKEFPLSERTSFALIVYAHNQSPWCERALRSIFEQEYDYYRVIFIDDASSDDTFDTAKSFILENNQDQRVILMRNEEEQGPVACLYRAIDNLLEKEIVIPLDAKDWLAHPGALTRMNAAFQNPDVWIAEVSGVEYPSYRIIPGGLSAFYAALFKELRLSDFYSGKKFARSPLSYMKPLRDLAGGRARNLEEPLIVKNETRPSKEQIDPFPPSAQNPLAEFPKPRASGEKREILLFSYDRPRQL